MQKIAVTGASGFIGRVFVRTAKAAGHEVIALSREEWRLGMPLPPSCDDADTVLHLACATLAARANLLEAAALDLRGAAVLLGQHRALRQSARRGRRFLFLSSQAARSDACNTYGQSKYSIELLLTGEAETIIRAGLVYDAEGGGAFGSFQRLARLPVLPVLSRDRCIQPIRLSELALALLRIAELPKAEKLYCLGAEHPLSLAETVAAVARQAGRRPPANLPLPAAPVRFIAGLADRMFRFSPSLLERIDALVALQPMDTARSLAALNLRLVAFG